MGQPKTERTQQLHKAARRYAVAQQANRAIEQHNFDKLVAQGTIVEGRPQERLNPHDGGVGYSHNLPRTVN